MNGLVVGDKVDRVYNYHRATIKHFQKLMSACGIGDPAELDPQMLKRRVTPTDTSDYREMFSYLSPGELIDGAMPPGWYASAWQKSRADSFAAA